MSDLVSTIAALSDEDAAGIEATLTARTEGVRGLAPPIFDLMYTRPLLAFRGLVVITRRPQPTNRVDKELWLRAHNNVCYLANFHGEPEERQAVVERALRVASENLAIYHNAACVLCKLGQPEQALDAIEQGIGLGLDDAAVQAMKDDTDLDLIRHTEAFAALVGERVQFELPGWAPEWTSREFKQFQEFVRTMLPDPDMSDFASGRIRCCGRECDMIGLAKQCHGRNESEWGDLILEHVRELVRK
ncbi:tetratricopeptide repeat protein [Enhygromyxa salina]|nr:hypothetical protein [Enhygromyxa salina]